LFLRFSFTEGEVFVPPHLYGELAKTEEGCKLIRQSGHFVQFVKALTTPPDQGTLLRRRASIWAIGHIGASETGFHFLEEYNVLPQLVQLAENSPSFSIRGYVNQVSSLKFSSFYLERMKSEYSINR
jgi:hypothetical protein